MISNHVSELTSPSFHYEFLVKKVLPKDKAKAMSIVFKVMYGWGELYKRMPLRLIILCILEEYSTGILKENREGYCGSSLIRYIFSQ